MPLSLLLVELELSFCSSQARFAGAVQDKAFLFQSPLPVFLLSQVQTGVEEFIRFGAVCLPF
jgi:hypothetical protein